MKRIISVLLALVLCAGMLCSLEPGAAEAAAKKPGRPTISLKAGKFNNAIKVSIGKTKNASSYQIFVRTKSQKSYKKAGTLAQNGKAKRTYTIGNLTAGKTYYVVVKAVSGTGKKAVVGKPSKVKSVKLGKAVKVTDKNIKVTKSEAAKVKFEEYKDPSGYFTVKIPKGWKVDYHMPGMEELPDLISYTLTVYDPKNVNRKWFLCLSTAGYTLSAKAKEWYQKTYPGTPQADLPYIDDISTEGYYKVVAPAYYGISDFTVVENLGKVDASGADLLSATGIGVGNVPVQGIFTAFTTIGYNYPDVWTGLNLGVATIYSIIYETAPQSEFYSWQPILDESFGSLTFTKKFQDERADQWRNVMKTSASITASGNDMSDMLMDSWEKRNKSEDIISQKQSDATLGYDRIYDSYEDKIYQAENGMFDSYSGSRYTELTNDDMYLRPIDGYITIIK